MRINLKTFINILIYNNKFKNFHLTFIIILMHRLLDLPVNIHKIFYVPKKEIDPSFVTLL